MKYGLYTLVIVFLIVAAGLGYLIAQQQRTADPEGLAAELRPCPLRLTLDGHDEDLPETQPDTGLEAPLAAWRVAQWHGEGTGPVVEVTHQEIVDAAGRTVPACTLKVTEVPKPPFDGIDWRIGYSVRLLRERVENHARMTFTTDLLADEAATLNGGSIYLYDGTAPIVAGLADVEAGWRPIEIDAALSANAGYIEIWIRLVLRGGISNPVTLTFANPTLSLHTARQGE